MLAGYDAWKTTEPVDPYREDAPDDETPPALPFVGYATCPDCNRWKPVLRSGLCDFCDEVMLDRAEYDDYDDDEEVRA